MDFITTDQLKEISLIHGNVDTERLGKLRDRSIQIYLRPFLGDEFYDYLVALSSPSAEETILVEEYLRQMITCATEIMSVKHFNWEIRNKSVGRSNDQYQQASTGAENDRLVNDYNKQFETYKLLTIDYLDDNSDSFPLWKCKGTSNSNQSRFSFVSRIRW